MSTSIYPTVLQTTSPSSSLFNIFSTSIQFFHYLLLHFNFFTMVRALLYVNTKPKVHFSCKSNHDRSQFPPKPKVVTMTQAQTQAQPYWASLQADIEAHVKKAMPIKEPLEVFEPMHHLIFAAPRTTVPALCLAACELVGGCRHQAMAAASALLLLHASTYTHEQLPLTDRPGPKPVIPHVYGPNIELLTGDGIFPFGFELLSRSDDPAERKSERILRVMVEISRSVGSKGVIEGQYWKRMLGESGGVRLCHVENIKRVVEKTEGGLHACGAACGAVMGGGSEEEVERLRKYGFYVGMIQGMVQMGLRDEVEEPRNLAKHELNFFKNRDVDAISSFMDV